MGIGVILVMPRSHMGLNLSDNRGNEPADEQNTPPLFRDDPMREKSWGRHMGGSRGELAKDIAKVVAVRIHTLLIHCCLQG